jgi:uncharacterized protein (TIGR03083 family)
MNDSELVTCMELTWRLLGEVCEELTEDHWSLPTDCPGWTVKDQLAHVAGTEARLLGRTPSEHLAEPADHVRNPLGEVNENEIDARRPLPPSAILDELREVATERSTVLRSWSKEDFDKDSWMPSGKGSARDFLRVRIFDVWTHEQDIRHAVGMPGHLDGDVTDVAFGLIRSMMPYVVAKKASAPDRARVAFDVTDREQFVVGVDGGRGRLVDGDEVPSVRLSVSFGALARLAAGRSDPSSARHEVEVLGDESLGARVLSQLAFVM